MRAAHKLACLLCFLLPAAGLADSGQVTYEPNEVVLSGHLVRQVFPGPPNYESIRGGDAKETAWILVLDKPVTVLGDAKSDLNTETERGQRRMQMTWYGSRKPDPQLVGPKVTITGTLYHASTGHHHTPVMLRAISIRARSRSWQEAADR